VLEDVVRRAGKHSAAEGLELGAERAELFVELRLLVPVEPLPRGGVSEGLHAQLPVLELLLNGQLLPGGQDDVLRALNGA